MKKRRAFLSLIIYNYVRLKINGHRNFTHEDKRCGWQVSNIFHEQTYVQLGAWDNATHT